MAFFAPWKPFVSISVLSKVLFALIGGKDNFRQRWDNLDACGAFCAEELGLEMRSLLGVR